MGNGSNFCDLEKCCESISKFLDKQQTSNSNLVTEEDILNNNDVNLLKNTYPEYTTESILTWNLSSLQVVQALKILY